MQSSIVNSMGNDMEVGWGLVRKRVEMEEHVTFRCSRKLLQS